MQRIRSRDIIVEPFAKAADALFESKGLNGFLSLGEAFHELVFQTELIEVAVADELRQIGSGLADTSSRWSPSSLLLSEGSSWQLRLELYDRDADTFHSMPYHAMVAVLGQEPLIIHRYPIGKIKNLEVFEPRYKLPEPLIEEYKPGQIAILDGRRDAVDSQITSGVLVAKLTSPKHATLQWAFSRSDRRATTAIAADSVATDLTIIAKILGDLSHSAAAGDLEELSRRHEAHHVRWAAIQALAKIAPDRARERLLAALKDKHPHIREAAERTLGKLERRAAAHG